MIFQGISGTSRNIVDPPEPVRAASRIYSCSCPITRRSRSGQKGCVRRRSASAERFPPRQAFGGELAITTIIQTRQARSRRVSNSHPCWIYIGARPSGAGCSPFLRMRQTIVQEVDVVSSQGRLDKLILYYLVLICMNH